MIISGGENIYSKEIEDVIMRMPAVREVAVFGIPDDIWGEAVCAMIVKKESHELEAEDVIEFCVFNLASYKKPKKIEFVGELPTNPSGKVTKNVLRERFWKGRARRL
jgi:acyl-CoA synthetase (AMP-forming)/AMP-acid ligase II